MAWDDTWQERKRERTISYWRNHKVKLRTCIACGGSGYYDSFGSPACASCDGTGRIRMPLNSTESAEASIRDVEQQRKDLTEARKNIKESRTPSLESAPAVAHEGRSR